jgi:hypothetical protein
MANWLLNIGSDLSPGSTRLFRGLGHVTSDHEAAADEHMPGYIHAHADLSITFECRTPPLNRLKLLQHLDAEQPRAQSSCSTATWSADLSKGRPSSRPTPTTQR